MDSLSITTQRPSYSFFLSRYFIRVDSGNPRSLIVTSTQSRLSYRLGLLNYDMLCYVTKTFQWTFPLS